MSEIKNKTNQSSGGNYHVISCMLSNSTVRDKYTKISIPQCRVHVSPSQLVPWLCHRGTNGWDTEIKQQLLLCWLRRDHN